MRKLLILLLLSIFVSIAVFGDDCRVVNCRASRTYGDVTTTFPLFGNVKVVTDPKAFVHFRVRIAKQEDCCPDLFVKIVTAKPKQCGEWRFVQSEKESDFTVMFVDEWEDFSILLVKSNPGCACEDLRY